MACCRDFSSGAGVIGVLGSRILVHCSGLLGAPTLDVKAAVRNKHKEDRRTTGGLDS